MSELDEFRTLYEAHVGHVASGDMKAALADMVQENIPAVFDGVDVPRAKVDAHDIRDIREDGLRMIGETVYHTEGRVIGLRSIWERQADGRWLAAELANFSVQSSDS